MAATSVSPTVHYLTVQDVLWINLQATKTVNPFDFAKLEGAVYRQYGYGASQDLGRQATGLMAALWARGAFTKGNQATAFLATYAFLTLNGLKPKLDDAGAEAWAEQLAKGDSSLVPVVRAHHHADETLEDVVSGALEAFPQTLQALGILR